MQVIGLCRFSYPAIGGFQVEHETVEERVAFLYDPERLEMRFAMFEAFTLPSLKAQTDQDFTFLVVIGDDLPDNYVHRLQNLVSGIPQVVLQRHAPGPHRDVMKAAINSVRHPSTDPCLQFRLDDDDAVAITYVETLRAKAEKATELLDQERSIAIDFNQGHIATPCAEGILAAPRQAGYWSPALALMISQESDTTVMNFSHHRIWKTMPTLTFPGIDMMVRGINDHNDSRQKASAKPVSLALLTPRQERRFRRIYNIDADQIRASFSTA